MVIVRLVNTGETVKVSEATARDLVTRKQGVIVKRVAERGIPQIRTANR